MPTPKPLTAREAAARLGITPSTVYALCRSGRMPHERHGLGRGTIRIAEADLDAYRASVRVPMRGPDEDRPATPPARKARGKSWRDRLAEL